MKIEKLPSGSYRVRKTINHVTTAFVFDHKPSQAEINQLVHDAVEKRDPVKITFRQASENYIASKKNVLSPNTIREYNSICDRLSEWFVDTKMCDITQDHINRQINELALDKAPKTVRNYHGFISSILGTYRPSFNIYTTLPQKVDSEAYIPTQDDIRRILEYAKGSEYYVPYVLACHGMRRGEILAIDPEQDIDGDVLHIRSAMAFTEDKEWVKKKPKTTESERDIIIPEDVAKEIKEKGYVFRYHPNKLSRRLNFIQDKLGIPRFGIHKMRHYFASYLHSQNVPDADIMKLGGWKTDNVMKNVYRHSMLDEEQKKRETMSKISDSIFS